MEGQQKRTFLPYLRGIHPEDLRLGSLYINPLEPTDGLASLRWEFMKDEEDQEEYDKQVKRWTRKRHEIDEPYSIEFQASKAKSLGFAFTDLVDFKGEKNKSDLVTIRGASGRRVKVKDPEAFLEEVMGQPGVNKWIREHATIEHKSRYGLNRWRAPKIWMVTAIQHVTGGEIHSESSASSKVGGGAGGDVGPAIGAPSGALKTKVDGVHEKTNGATTDFSHKDERIWAAQFMPVSIEFGPQQDAELTLKHGTFLPRTIAQFQLKDVPNLGVGGIRDTGFEQMSRPTGPVPKLIGRVTVQQPVDTPEDDEDEDEDDGFIIDDSQYVANAEETDWAQYDAYKKWLWEVERDATGEQIR